MTAAMDNPNTMDYWNDVYRQESQRDGGECGRRIPGLWDAVLSLIAEGGRVLDNGCGHGMLSEEIAASPTGSTVIGADFAHVPLASARARGSTVAFVCADARQRLPFPDESFDAIVMVEVIEHLDEAQQALHHAFAVLRVGGTMIVSCPHDDAIPHAEHIWRWGHDELFHALAHYAGDVTFHDFGADDGSRMLVSARKERQPAAVPEPYDRMQHRDELLLQLKDKAADFRAARDRRYADVQRLKERLEARDERIRVLTSRLKAAEERVKTQSRDVTRYKRAFAQIQKQLDSLDGQNDE